MITPLEVRRQLAHLLFGTIIVILLWTGIINSTLLLFATALVTLVSLAEMAGFRLWIIEWFNERLERHSEREGMRAKGLVFYLLGCSLATYLFPTDIAMASIVILAFGDSISRLAGPYGFLRHPWNSKKFVEGVVVGWIAAAIPASFFVAWYYAVPAAAVAMFLESLDIEINSHKLDDNLTIPLVAGSVMVLLGLF